MLAFCSLIMLSSAGLGPAQTAKRSPYSFACHSSYFMLEDFAKQSVVTSPDSMKSVQLTSDYKFRVRVGRTVIAEFGLPEISCSIEVGWSPNSTQFFVSYSDAGATGGFHVHLYCLNGNTLHESMVPSLVAGRFKEKHWCETRGNNLFFLGWTPDSKIAFFVAEVYPTSDCGKEMGMYRGYAVNMTNGEIVHAFGEKRTQAIERKCRASGTLVLP
jgi:hypothetical protein